MAILSYCYDCSFRQLQELEIQKSLKPGPFRMSTFPIWLYLQYLLQKKRVQLALVQPKDKKLHNLDHYCMFYDRSL